MAESSLTLQELIVLARIIAPKGLVRTDTAADFELNFYESGSTIIMQCFSQKASAWRAVTLS
jgi:hypothetical protein